MPVTHACVCCVCVRASCVRVCRARKRCLLPPSIATRRRSAVGARSAVARVSSPSSAETHAVASSVGRDPQPQPNPHRRPTETHRTHRPEPQPSRAPTLERRTETRQPKPHTPRTHTPARTPRAGARARGLRARGLGPLPVRPVGVWDQRQGRCEPPAKPRTTRDGSHGRETAHGQHREQGSADEEENEEENERTSERTRERGRERENLARAAHPTAAARRHSPPRTRPPLNHSARPFGRNATQRSGRVWRTPPPKAGRHENIRTRRNGRV